jgi:hypothetical protein
MDSSDKKSLSERNICTKFITPSVEQAEDGVLHGTVEDPAWMRCREEP